MLKIIMFFSLVGPMLGSFGLLAFGLSNADVHQNQALVESIFITIAGAIFLGIWGAFLAIFFGIIPATVAGLCYWLILKMWTDNNPVWHTRLIVGALLGLITSTIYGYWFTSGSKDNTLEVVGLYWAGPGAFSSAICALAVTNRFYKDALLGRK